MLLMEMGKKKNFVVYYMYSGMNVYFVAIFLLIYSYPCIRHEHDLLPIFNCVPSFDLIGRLRYTPKVIDGKTVWKIDRLSP